MKTTIDIHKLAKLAKLTINKEEESFINSKIQGLFSYFEVLEEVALDSEEHKKDESLQENYRPDEAKLFFTDKPLSFSPYTENNFFKVPSIINSE